MIDAVYLPMTLNGVDFSQYFRYTLTPQSERLRKINGPNAGREVLDGTEWTDLRRVKYDLTATILPMGPEKLAELCEILAMESYTQTYFSGMRNEIVTRTVIVPAAEVILGMIKQSGRVPIYADMSVTFREK